MSKKFISVLLSLTMLMSLFPLSIVFATNNSEILVGINTPFAPFEKKVNGEYVGYDIEVMNYICSQLNLKPKYIDMDFDKLMPSLISGEIDCIISAITATETRMQYADFTRPYFVGRFVYPEETIDVFERLSITLPKGSGYRQQFNDIIFEAEKNGVFKNIATKYNLVYDDTMTSSKDTSDSPQYIIYRDDRSVTTSDKSGKYLLEYYYDKIILNPLIPNSEKINRLIQEDCDNFFGDDDGSWVIDSPPIYENEVYVNGCQAIVTKNDGNIFSIKIRTDWYAGGVHNAGYYGLNYNLKTGAALTLSDLFKMPDDELLHYLKECSKKYIDQHPDMYWWDDNFQNAKHIIDEYALSDFEFYIEGNNVCVCYPVYELGPGAMGPVIVECPIFNNEIQVVLNGEKIKFDQPPVMINDRVMVPIRAIFEAMEYSVNWDGDTQTAEAIKSTNKITVQINNSIIKYIINGKSGTYECDVVPQIISERTLVPVRAIAECAGCDVQWDGENTTVIITYYENSSNQLAERKVKALLLAGYDDNEDANKKQNHLDANRLSVDYVERALNALNVYKIEKYYMENDNNYMSASQLSTLLSQIFKETTDDDLSIIYYSGHSFYYFDEHDNEKHVTAFSNYTFEDFYNIIRENVKGDVLLMYDGCYAGELMNLNNYDDRIKIIAACDEDDYSSSYYLSEIDTTSDENQICSVFAYALYNGAINNINYLDSNNDKTVVFDELYVYMLNSVYNICDRITTQEDKLNRLKDMLGLDSALRIAQIVQSYPNSDKTPLFTIK